MKRGIVSILVIAALVMGIMVSPKVAVAATAEEIQSAIEAGLYWLASQQNPDGSWGFWDQKVAVTGFAVLKFEEQAFELGLSPFDPEYEYYDEVITGLDYIFSQAHATSSGLVWFGFGTFYETYSTGIAMAAIAAGGDLSRVVTVPGAVNGWTYQQVLEGTVQYFVNSQNPDGGWSYGLIIGFSNSDNSNAGYAVLGLAYAEQVGISIPPTLKTNLGNWIDFIQNDVDGDPNDGGSGYMNPVDWVNTLKTGHLLFEMAFVGDTAATQRVIDAVDYIERHWNDLNPDPGWRNWPGYPNHKQAMYCLMKGMAFLNIQTIEVGGIDVDWYQEFADAILPDQLPDGSFPWDYWGDQLLATEWALLTLEGAIPPIPVEIDIKPWSDPNAINLRSNGVIPVAVLTSESFDVAMIDPATLDFAGAAAVHWACEDVDYDGDMDLIAHFRTQETGLVPGNTEAVLTGRTWDGYSFRGVDSIRTVPMK